MNKKILVGSIIAVVILLLMPSIPAIQQKSIEDRAYNDLVEQLDFKDVKELKEVEWTRHPLLYALVITLMNFRWERCLKLGDIAFEINNWGVIDIKHPLLFLRCLWLIFTLEIWCLFWNNVSDKFGWGWNVSPIL